MISIFSKQNKKFWRENSIFCLKWKMQFWTSLKCVANGCQCYFSLWNGKMHFRGFSKTVCCDSDQSVANKKSHQSICMQSHIQVTNLFRELLHTVIFDPLYLYRRDSCSALCIFKKSVGVSYMLLKQSSNIKKGCCANTKKNGNDAWLIIKFKHSFFNLVKIVNHFLLFLVLKEVEIWVMNSIRISSFRVNVLHLDVQS